MDGLIEGVTRRASHLLRLTLLFITSKPEDLH